MCSDVKNNGFEAVIEVRNLVAHYGEQLVLNDVTVSYTHLRAHETVLDLVCRLLLEKKKHTTT